MAALVEHHKMLGNSMIPLQVWLINSGVSPLDTRLIARGLNTFVDELRENPTTQGLLGQMAVWGELIPTSRGLPLRHLDILIGEEKPSQSQRQAVDASLAGLRRVREGEPANISIRWEVWHPKIREEEDDGYIGTVGPTRRERERLDQIQEYSPKNLVEQAIHGY